MSERTEEIQNFFNTIKPCYEQLDVLKGTIVSAGPFHSMDYIPGFSRRRKLLGFIPFGRKTIAEVNRIPYLNKAKNIWEGPFVITAFELGICERLIFRVQRLGIECKIQIYKP